MRDRNTAESGRVFPLRVARGEGYTHEWSCDEGIFFKKLVKIS
jgi:hypothetical protein